MDVELDDETQEPRDYTRWIWLSVIVLVVALMGLLYMYSGLSPHQSLVRVRHILIQPSTSDPGERGRALELLRDIRRRVLAGEDFGDLAELHSNDPGSASKGGNLGWVKRGELAQEIDNYIWTAPIGQLSDIIQTKFGFHIVVVDDRRLSSADELRMKKEEEFNRRLNQGNVQPGGDSQSPASP